MAVLPEEEAAEVAVLIERLSKMTSLTDKISLSLGNLTSSAQLVEKSVQPILNQTGTLTILAANIDAGITEIDKTMRLLDLVKQEDQTIRRGPQSTGLSEYLSSLKRLSEGLARLKSTNLRSSQKAVKDMTALLKTGAIQLEDLFRKTLIAESNPVEPLHYLTKQLPFPVFANDKVNTLAVLNEFLSSTIASSSGLQSNSTTIYAEVRGPYIQSSLSTLAQGSINTTTKRTAAPYEKGENGIVHYSPALEKIFEAEYENICRLFAASKWSSVYTATTQPAMTAFASCVRQLNAYVKQNMMTDCFLAYDVIECVNTVAKNLGMKTGEKSEFNESLKPIRQTAGGSFYELMDDMKKQGSPNSQQPLPADMSVCPLTTTVMSRLRRMTDYQNAVSGLLITLGDKNWNRPFTPTVSTSAGFDVGADGKFMLANYCLEMIETSLGLIEQKAKTQFKKQSTVAVLMINNIAYVESSIRRSGLITILGLGSGMAKIEKIRKKHVEEYLAGWKDAASFLFDTINTKNLSGPSGAAAKPNLSSKDKDAVKEKFKSFNLAFDELVAKHKQYSFPDRDVKTMLYKEVCFVAPLYGRFWDKYHEVVKDKHVKYDRAGLDAVLATLQ